MKNVFVLPMPTLLAMLFSTLLLITGCTDAPNSAEQGASRIYYDISWSAPTTRADGSTPLPQADIAGYVVEIYHGNQLIDTIDVDAATLTTSYLVPTGYIDKPLRAEVRAIDGEDSTTTPYIAFSDILSLIHI